MRWLLFLSRLAFICGICILLTLILLFTDIVKDQDITGTLITIGFFIGMIVIPVTLIAYLVIVMLKRKLVSIVPLWLVVSNIIFLFILLIYIILINGQSNHST